MVGHFAFKLFGRPLRAIVLIAAAVLLIGPVAAGATPTTGTGAGLASAPTRLKACATTKSRIAKDLRRESAYPVSRSALARDVRVCHGNWAVLHPECMGDCQYAAKRVAGRWRFQFGWPTSPADEARMPGWMRQGVSTSGALSASGVQAQALRACYFPYRSGYSCDDEMVMVAQAWLDAVLASNAPRAASYVKAPTKSARKAASPARLSDWRMWGNDTLDCAAIVNSDGSQSKRGVCGQRDSEGWGSCHAFLMRKTKSRWWVAGTVVPGSCFGSAANRGGNPIMKLAGAKWYFDIWGSPCSRSYCRHY